MYPSQNLSIGLIFLFVLTLAGCEKLETLKTYFQSRTKPVAKTILAEPKAPLSPTPSPSANLSPAKTESSEMSTSLQGDVLARVGDWTLTAPEFKERLEALKQMVPDYDPKDRESNKLVLEELIRQQLLVQEAINKGLDQNKDLIDAVEEFRRTLLVREMVTEILEQVKVTEEDAKKYYDANKQDFISPIEWKVREIIVDEEAKAKEILIDLYKGIDFAEMATNKSKSETAQKGGDLGYVSQFPFPQMESTVQALEVGGVSGVVKGPAGYYIVKLEQNRGGEQKEYEEIK
ncbi:MAG: peptidyl-prolyl cis-trans isomerase, partial [Candidatus Omnitrophica bacterium]|nr:peptidyl-prolyl cis-trans isomerase [Candidatus Omnitrophota bacterium]